MTDIKPWNGLPENPERNGWHWLQNRKPNCDPYPVLWSAGKGWVWQAIAYFPAPDTAFRYRYLGPCLTPAEVTALGEEVEEIAAAWEDRAVYFGQNNAHAAFCRRSSAMLRALAAERAALIKARSSWEDDARLARAKALEEAAVKAWCVGMDMHRIHSAAHDSREVGAHVAAAIRALVKKEPTE